MKNRGMFPDGWEPLKPTAAEIADYKHRKELAAKIEKALMLGVDQLTEALMISARACGSEEPLVYMRGVTRREVINTINALGKCSARPVLPERLHHPALQLHRGDGG